MKARQGNLGIHEQLTTCTENRLYIGCFDLLMIPTLLTATSVFTIPFSFSSFFSAERKDKGEGVFSVKSAARMAFRDWELGIVDPIFEVGMEDYYDLPSA